MKKKANSTPAHLYAGCLEEIKTRIAFVRSILNLEITVGPGHDEELVCVQLRKMIELIAFSSLIANKRAYANASKKFATHWNARLLFRDIERINPGFYPTPLVYKTMKTNPRNHEVESMKSGYATKNELLLLYERCAQGLHARNPYRTDDGTIYFKYSVADWLIRIEKLLGIHMTRLVGTDDDWIGMLNNPEDGKAHTYVVTARA